jgi:hypothetical protein
MIVARKLEMPSIRRTGLTAILLCVALSRGWAQEGLVCESHPPYFLVIRARTDSVNSDVLVKYDPVCAYRVGRTDYELKDVNTNRFVKFVDPYLFLGGSTSPDVGDLVVYNLKARAKVYEHIFAGKDIRISGNTVFYVQSLGRAKREQCKDYDKIVSQDFRPILEAEVSFQVEDLAHPEKLKSLNPSKIRCVAHQ